MPRYDKAYEAARLMPTDRSGSLLRTMNEIIKEEVPIVIGQNTLRFGITQKWLSNFKRNLLAPEYMYLDVNMALKSKACHEPHHVAAADRLVVARFVHGRHGRVAWLWPPRRRRRRSRGAARRADLVVRHASIRRASTTARRST